MRRLIRLILFVFASIGLVAIAQAQLLDAWFTRGPLPPPNQTFPISSPRMALPLSTETFDRAKDEFVIMIVVFSGGGPHTWTARLKSPSNQETTVKRTVGPIPRITSGWRYTNYGWKTSDFEEGKYTVELTVDDTPAGTHAFTVR